MIPLLAIDSFGIMCSFYDLLSIALIVLVIFTLKFLIIVIINSTQATVLLYCELNIDFCLLRMGNDQYYKSVNTCTCVSMSANQKTCIFQDPIKHSGTLWAEGS